MFGSKSKSKRVLVRKSGYLGLPPSFSDVFAANPFAVTVKKSASHGLDLASLFSNLPARALVQKAMNVRPVASRPEKPVPAIRPDFAKEYKELETRLTTLDTPADRKPSQAELAALESLARIKADLERISRNNDALAARGIRPTAQSDLKRAGSGNAHSLRMYSGQLLERMFGGGHASHERECDKAYGNTPNQSRRPGGLSL